MAKLANKDFNFHGDADGSVSFKSSMTVDSDGTFRCDIPDEYGNNEDFRKFARSIKVPLNDYRGKWRVCSNTMDGIEDRMSSLFDGWLKSEMTEELVILCHAIANCHYVKDKAGELHPNGCFAKEADELAGVKDDSMGCLWNESLTVEKQFGINVSVHDYCVGLKAIIRLKQTHTRGSSVQTEYRFVSSESESLGEWGSRLNAFVHVAIPDYDSHEMPYTEDAARFLYMTMMALCQMHDRMVEFFGGDDFVDKFQKILTEGAVPALMSGENKS